MIASKKELHFYIAADTMINRGYFAPPISKRISQLFSPDIIVDFLKSMRCYSYYGHQSGYLNRIMSIYYKHKFLQLSKKCGFSIGCDCFGYGLLIHHYGTIVCGGNNRIGNFAVINTSTCITKNCCTIGDFLYMGTGAVISKHVTLYDNVKICANTLINKSFDESNVVLAGQPASIKKYNEENWMQCYDGNSSTMWQDRYEKIINLKKRLRL